MESEITTEKPASNWPAWVIAFFPLIFLTNLGLGLNVYSATLINATLWGIDYVTNKKSGLHWITVVAVILFPPAYLWMRYKEIKDTPHYLYVSILVLVALLALS